MTRTRIASELGTDPLGWLLTRPQRVANLMRHWRHTYPMVEEVVRSCHLICQADGVDPADFSKHYDPTVTIAAGQRYIIIQLDT